MYEIITEIEENTYLNYNEDETILTLSSEEVPIAQIGEITYTDLQEAIEATTEKNRTIKILRNIVYTIDNAIIIIPNTKNVILDLNGHKITSSIPENLSYVHSDDNEMTLNSYVKYNNDNDVIEIYKDTGGEEEAKTQGFVRLNEDDEFWAESIIVTKPTGEDKQTPNNIIIIAVSSIAALGVGIVLIKKFVLKK